MNGQFFKNLDSAYKALEDLLNQSKSEADRSSANNQHYSMQDKFLILGKYFPAVDSNHRVPIPLGQGYLVKMKINTGQYRIFNGDQTTVFYTRNFGAIGMDKFQEANVQLLSNRGFTKENGFYVPLHKVVGVKMVNGKAQVDPQGDGWTITEDISEGGTYHISDIAPYHFATLNNRQAFTESYWRHITKLLELCDDPSLDIDIYRHGRPKNPVEPISKMLLLKEKGNIGETVVGDLNNLEFRVKESHSEIN